ncbi:LysR family transcriptional regulator [Streptomyces sp. CB01881]|uniref:LysR family transcriptional regulator n=1 Tax=Streptomyces sp. CB01881 TaxID=2078691 RepID=UPI000CDBE086|nr:LysR family transcriptional regulator [Streptomyces sp. CB01881]AUY50520.1 LysR family transcriptional regulator [Streptomyces sp. CB01881]TYC73908.1 LysR family transcriptional regulator [Streptomyces sp. CB01881]
MDLDLAQVRAFAVAAEELHFGRAAARLAISQQALSKRVARLEAALGARLLDRDARGVALTGAGRRFLEPARRLLVHGDHAVAAVACARRPLRIDVWGHLYAPMRTVAQAVEGVPGLEVEPEPGRDLPSVAAALLRGESDAGFGRVHPLPDGRDTGLAHRLVRLEPVDALLSTDHPLAGRDVLRPADLRDSVLRYPAAVDRLDFLTRFADRFGIAGRTGSANLGLEHFVERVRTDPACFSLLPADCPLPEPPAAPGRPGVRTVPLADPTPLYAWSLVWRDGDGPGTEQRHPQLDQLLRAFGEEARRSRWLEYDPARDWLPGPDQEALDA